MDRLKKFWETKKLESFSDEEWEAVCMKCGWCCVEKYSPQNSRKVMFSNILCEHFDFSSGCCSCYNTRLQTGECLKVNMDLIRAKIELLPPFCAYRLLAEGKPLPSYHPLISGNEQSVHEAGRTVQEYEGFVDGTKLLEELETLNQRAKIEEMSQDVYDLEQEKLYQKYPIKCVFMFDIP